MSEFNTYHKFTISYLFVFCNNFYKTELLQIVHTVQKRALVGNDEI